MSKEELTKHNLNFLYWECKMSIREIARKLGVNHNMVLSKMVSLDVPRRPKRLVAGAKRKYNLDEFNVASMYRSGMSLRRIAARFNCSQETIRNTLKRMNIPRRRRGWRQDQSKLPHCPGCGLITERGELCEYCLDERDEERRQNGEQDILCEVWEGTTVE